MRNGERGNIKGERIRKGEMLSSLRMQLLPAHCTIGDTLFTNILF